MTSKSYYQLGCYRYYPERQKLLHDKGQELSLRPQSLAVLHLLVSDAGEIVSKDKMFKTVWPNTYVTDDSLVQCIADIRRTLGDKKHQILQTVPRRGYVLKTTDRIGSSKPHKYLSQSYKSWRCIVNKPEFSVAIIALLLLLLVFKPTPALQRNISEKCSPPSVQTA